MKRIVFFSYGVACHLMFLAVYAYLCGFVGNYFLPKTIDFPATDSVPDCAGGRYCTPRTVWPATLDYGPAGIQTCMDALYSCADRAQHLRADLQPAAHPPRVAMARH